MFANTLDHFLGHKIPQSFHRAYSLVVEVLNQAIEPFDSAARTSIRSIHANKWKNQEFSAQMFNSAHLLYIASRKTICKHDCRMYTDVTKMLLMNSLLANVSEESFFACFRGAAGAAGSKRRANDLAYGERIFYNDLD
jgi:hypothetical protein